MPTPILSHAVRISNPLDGSPQSLIPRCSRLSRLAHQTTRAFGPSFPFLVRLKGALRGEGRGKVKRTYAQRPQRGVTPAGRECTQSVPVIGNFGCTYGACFRKRNSREKGGWLMRQKEELIWDRRGAERKHGTRSTARLLIFPFNHPASLARVRSALPSLRQSSSPQTHQQVRHPIPHTPPLYKAAR